MKILSNRLVFILNDFFMRKKRNYWNKENTFSEAKKYKTRKEFFLGSPRAYEYLRKNELLDNACEHMGKPYKNKFVWSIDSCREKALKYKFRKEFQVGDKNAYQAAKYNGWLNEVCKHMEYKKLPNKHWHSFENCKNEALKYKTKTDFVRNSQHVYNIALKKGWIDDICKHMIPRGDKYYRCIYSYEFSDNHVYVGLTNDLERRKLDRKKDKKDAVNIYIVKTNIIPNIKKLTEYISIEEAIKMEKYYYDKYLNEGWKMLNRTKTGGLGGSNFK